VKPAADGTSSMPLTRADTLRSLTIDVKSASDDLASRG
jgi:hypothetical protein